MEDSIKSASVLTSQIDSLNAEIDSLRKKIDSKLVNVIVEI